MKSNGEREVRRQESGVRRAATDWKQVVLGLFVMLLALGFSPSLRAQTVNLGGTGALGAFINPTSVTTNTQGQSCGYAVLQIDLAQGKVFAIPNRTTANAVCLDQSPVDITNVAFTNPPTGPINNGVLEVTDFTLRPAFGPSTFIDGVFGFGGNNTHLVFVANANNTPVWIRATGNVTINGSSIMNLNGASGANGSTFLRGAGGLGGPGGFRGGDGGNGGIFPSAGSSGFGPGGGVGGAVNSNSLVGPKFLTTGVTVGGTSIPTANDLLTLLRGGSGGGGGGGATTAAARGGGGGGGAILIAANNTIAVNGTITASGGESTCCTGLGGTGGSGGAVRLVAATIAGGGSLGASPGGSGCTVGPCPGATSATAGGVVRLEAFTISYTGSFGGGTNVAAASSPGQVILPGTATASAFLQISKVTNSANAGETVSPSLPSQDVAGRTGKVNPVDVTMPDLDALPASTVDVEFTVGPCPAFPAGKNVTLVVAPLDPAQGASASYTTSTPIDCGSTPHAKITGVSLPLGFSNFSAFTVLNIDTGGALAQMFPTTYEGEAIEAVRLETGEQGMEYVLIAESGREFPYRPQ
jgi:hypothetical protein